MTRMQGRGRERAAVRLASVVGVLLLGLAGAGGADAQTRKVIVGEAADPAEIARLFDAYTVMQAQEKLGLSDEQFGPFVTRLKALQQARRRQVRERFQAVQEMRRLLDGAATSESLLREKLDALAKLDAAAQADTARASAAVDEILDVRQRARFRVLEQQLELRKLELVGRARQRLRTPPPQ